MSFVIELIYWVVLAALGILGSGAIITATLLFLEYIFEKGKKE